MKIGTLVNPEFVQALNDLSKQNIPIKTAFKLKGIMKQCRDEQEKYFALRKEVLEKYADKDEKGNPIIEKEVFKLSSEAEKEVSTLIIELMETDVSISTIGLIELGESIKISTDTLFLLDDVIV